MTITTKSAERGYKTVLLLFFEPFLAIFFIFLSCLSLSFSTDFSVEMFCNHLTDSLHHTYSDFVPPIVSLKLNSEKRLSDPSLSYEKMFFAISNSENKTCFRLISDRSVSVHDSANSVGFNSYFVGQYTFSASKTDENTYSIDGGHYFTYFPANLKKNLTLITDEMADMIINQVFGITVTDANRIQSYTDYLNTNPVYVADFVYVDEESGLEETKNVDVSIANIVYSSKGYAKHIVDLYGNLILSYAPASTEYRSVLESHIEYEPKLFTYGNKRVLYTIDSKYSDGAIEASFRSFDYEAGQYLESEKLAKEYSAIKKNNDFWPVFIASILLCLYLLLDILIKKKKTKNETINLWNIVIWAALIFITGIVTNFVYTYTFFGMTILLVLSFHALVYGKEGERWIYEICHAQIQDSLFAVTV